MHSNFSTILCHPSNNCLINHPTSVLQFIKQVDSYPFSNYFSMMRMGQIFDKILVRKSCVLLDIPFSLKSKTISNNGPFKILICKEMRSFIIIIKNVLLWCELKTKLSVEIYASACVCVRVCLCVYVGALNGCIRVIHFARL